MRFLLQIISITTLVAVGLVALPQPASAAQTTPPPYSHSWYVRTDDTMVNYNQGVTDGTFDNSTCTHAMNVLDFGQIDYNQSLDSYMVFIQGINQWKTTAQVTDAMKNYAFGWYHAAGSCPTLQLAIGISNFNMCPNDGGQGGGLCSPYWAGRNWAKVATDVQSYLVAQGYSWQITALGAGDWETNGARDGWDCASKTRSFVDGFASNNPSSLHLENFGDATGYGTSYTPSGAVCWTNSDIQYVSYGAAPAYTLGQNYNSTRNTQWVNLRVNYVVAYDGVMSECNQNADPLPTGNCNVLEGGVIRSEYSPTAGWNALWNGMNAASVPQAGLNYATNIRYQS